VIFYGFRRNILFSLPHNMGVSHRDSRFSSRVVFSLSIIKDYRIEIYVTAVALLVFAAPQARGYRTVIGSQPRTSLIFVAS